jgi:hypothetical protein
MHHMLPCADKMNILTKADLLGSPLSVFRRCREPAIWRFNVVSIYFIRVVVYSPFFRWELAGGRRQTQKDLVCVEVETFFGKRATMLSSSQKECAASLQEQELRQGLLLCGFALAWIILLSAKLSYLRSRISDSPKFASMYFYSIGIL